MPAFSIVTIVRLHYLICQPWGTEQGLAGCDKWPSPDAMFHDACCWTNSGILAVRSVIGEEPLRRNCHILDNVHDRHIGARFLDISAKKPYLDIVVERVGMSH
jgi:hypothetical protein